MKVYEDADGKAYVRGGRQELLFGSQRSISPPDWNNTRRTFNGVRGYYQTKEWDFDLFWVQPVIPHPTRIDSIDHKQHFAGAWVTHRPEKGQFRDFYYLYLDNANSTTQQGIGRAPINVHSIGTRWAGDKCNVLYDAEAVMQYGEARDQAICAGAFSGGLGYNWADLPMNPIFWLYYDVASGDQNPNKGGYHTYSQLFPFGHYYLGWIDVVGRQNIQDINAHVYLYPTKWITLNAQFHQFSLVSSRDALYGASGAVLRRDATGKAGRDVGQEIDLIANFHMNKYTDFLVSYSYLRAGNFLQQTGSGIDPQALSCMVNIRW